MWKNTKTYNIGVFTFCNVLNCPSSQKKKKKHPNCLHNRKLATVLFCYPMGVQQSFKNDILH